MKKSVRIIIISAACLAGACVAGMAITGWQINWGPVSFLFKGYESEVAAIEKKYDSSTRKGEIVFYGASNFRLWTEMENDLAPFPVQNHGFGGSTDKMLVQYADRILYPYEPEIIFFQTGSNDYVGLSGSDEEKIAVCMEYKKYMYELFHEKLPEAKFVVMSGLLLPGRSEYTALTQELNRQLAAFCEEKDYMIFADASEMTYDGSSYRSELFIDDGIHLNHDGLLLWANNYILPVLKQLYE